MFETAFKNLDRKKWFDRMQPQTLAIATWLLYLNGAFSLIDIIDNNQFQYLLHRDSTADVLSVIACAALIGGPFLMANGKKLGWYVSLVGAFSPFVLRAYVKFSFSSDLFAIPFSWVIKGQGLVNFAFEAALCALLLHPMTRTFVDRWLR